MEDKEIAITLKGSVWNVVLNALAARPYAEVVSILNDIQRQASTQIEAPPSEDGRGAA